jgi:hypothetical protein
MGAREHGGPLICLCEARAGPRMNKLKTSLSESLRICESLFR